MNKIRKKQPQGNNMKKSFSKLSPLRKGLLFGFLGLLAINTLPAVIVLLIGLLPTITVIITSPKNTNKLIVVGGFNMAGVFVYLISVINQFNIDSAFSILSDVFNLIIMLGSAALGLIIYYEIPQLFLYISKSTAQKRLANIDKRLEKITEDWGNEAIESQVSKLTKTS